MRYIVPPQSEDQQCCNKPGGGQGGPPIEDPIICISHFITHCALCSEDIRFCEPE
jgi:hypothetical protein